MKAAYYTRRGPAREVLQVGEVDDPRPQADEVRVRVLASGVNPSDWKSRSGLTTSAPVDGMVIPHSDGAGVVETVGAGVDPRRIGERVWLWNAQWQRSRGTAAEFVTLPARQAVTLPAGVDFEVGACLGIPAMTALQAVRLAAVAPGDEVLVHGGAGAVGNYAIQFAHHRGARVLATVSGESKAVRARAAGAVETIDYRVEDVGARVRAATSGRGVRAVIDVDFSANARLLPELIRPHGRVVVYGTGRAESTVPALWMMRNSITVASFLVYDLSSEDRDAVIEEIQESLRTNRLIHSVARRLPLDRIVEAHELLERGELIGNLVIVPDAQAMD